MFLDKKNLELAKMIILLVCFVFICHQFFPHIFIYAKEVEIDFGRGPVKLNLINHPDNPKIQGDQIQTQLTGNLPEINELPYYETWITATAYTSRVQECDADPFTAAWGDHVFWGMVASNAFRKGTKIQIPEYYGDKMFSVLDKMNERYFWAVDVWMEDLDQAKNWGVKYVKIKVFR